MNGRSPRGEGGGRAITNVVGDTCRAGRPCRFDRLHAHRAVLDRGEQYEFSSPEVPPQFDGTKIVLLTDIHRGWFFSEERVHGLVERVNALHPDLIALTGDYVYADTGYEPSGLLELAGLQAPLGRFAVLGNHDYGEYSRRNHRPFGGYRSDQSRPASNCWTIAGSGWNERGTHSTGRSQRLHHGACEPLPHGLGTSPSDLVMLFHHNPDYAESIPAARSIWCSPGTLTEVR